MNWCESHGSYATTTCMGCINEHLVNDARRAESDVEMLRARVAELEAKTAIALKAFDICQRERDEARAVVADWKRRHEEAMQMYAATTDQLYKEQAGYREARAEVQELEANLQAARRRIDELGTANAAATLRAERAEAEVERLRKELGR